MNLAVMIVGTISPTQFVGPSIVKRDWKWGADSITENIINCWDSTINLSTYLSIDMIEDMSLVSSMVEYYKPRGLVVQHTNMSNASHLPDAPKFNRMIHKYLIGLSMLLQQRDIDFVITLRPDIKVHKKISSLNIDFQKFNFLFKENNHWEKNNLVCDNLFAFNYKYVPAFIESIQEMDITMHNSYNNIKNIIDDSEINFMVDEHHSSYANSIYEVNRIYV